MSLIPAPRPVDLSAFDASDDEAGIKYGLPRYVAFCKHCVISNQRPNSAVEYQHTKASKKATINFDEGGVCDACRYAEHKRGTIDWKQREDQLAALCDKFRSKSGYDCLVPGSGGKDSFYASHVLKTRFGMHPLTVTWAPHVYTEWGWKNFQSWLHAGFDNELTTPNGRVHRLLTRLAVENLFHPFQPFIFGQKSLAPKMAVLHDIPFVIYGENEAEYGNPIGDTNSAKRDWSYFTAKPVRRFRAGGPGPAALPAGRPRADRKEEHRGALPRLLPQVASAELLLLRGGARRLRGLTRTHAGHVQQVQQHRRPHRRLPLLHHLREVRHRPRDLRRRAGDPLGRHYAR
jgi:hypothetical protein